MAKRMASTSTFVPFPVGYEYGMDVVGPIPPGSTRSTESEYALTHPMAPTGRAMIVGGLAVLGIGALLWMTRQK